MSPVPDPSQQARAPRASVFLSATAERFGKAETSRHRVRNLSPGGACIDRAAAFRNGETLVIAVGTLKAVGAVVRWTDDGLAGLAFSEVIDMDKALAKAAVKPAVRAGQPMFRPPLK